MLRNFNLPAPLLRAIFNVSCKSLDNGAAAVLTSHSLSSAICRTAPCLWNYTLCLKTIVVSSNAIHNRPGRQGNARRGATGGSTIAKIVTTSLLAIANLQARKVLDRRTSKLKALLFKVQQLAPKMNGWEISHTLRELGKLQAHLALDGLAGKALLAEVPRVAR
jgi:hypothetical protein